MRLACRPAARDSAVSWPPAHHPQNDVHPEIIVHYEYMALAKHTSVLREAMLLFLEALEVNPAPQSVVNNDTIVARRVCGHLLKPC